MLSKLTAKILKPGSLPPLSPKISSTHNNLGDSKLRFHSAQPIGSRALSSLHHSTNAVTTRKPLSVIMTRSATAKITIAKRTPIQIRKALKRLETQHAPPSPVNDRHWSHDLNSKQLAIMSATLKTIDISQLDKHTKLTVLQDIRSIVVKPAHSNYSANIQKKQLYTAQAICKALCTTLQIHDNGIYSQLHGIAYSMLKKDTIKAVVTQMVQAFKFRNTKQVVQLIITSLKACSVEK